MLLNTRPLAGPSRSYSPIQIEALYLRYLICRRNSRHESWREVGEWECGGVMRMALRETESGSRSLAISVTHIEFVRGSGNEGAGRQFGQTSPCRSRQGCVGCPEVSMRGLDDWGCSRTSGSRVLYSRIGR